MYTGMERSICLTKIRQSKFPSNWQAAVGKAFSTLQDLIKSMLSRNPADRPSAEEVAHHIHSLLGEFTILSLDKYDADTILLRVEADHGDNVLHDTMQGIHKAALPGSVEIVQYGLRSAKSGTVAVMEFALQTSTLQGSVLVSTLTERPEIIKVRQVSSNHTAR
jgi:serine/threonine protein kinase